MGRWRLAVGALVVVGGLGARGANPSSGTVVVGGRGARGANPSSGTFLLWRLALGARIRVHELLGESEPRDWRCRSERESEPTNFWANPSSGIGAADRQSELTNFLGKSEPANFSSADGLDQGYFWGMV